MSPASPPLITSVAVLAMRSGVEEDENDQVRRMKRDAAIAAKEQEHERKRAALEARKRRELADLIEADAAETEKRKQAHLRHLEHQASMKKQKKDRELRDQQKRGLKIRIKEESWHKRATAEVLDVVQSHKEDLDNLEAAYAAARQEKEAIDVQNMIKEAEWQELYKQGEARRDEKNAKRTLERQMRAALRTDEIKEEARDELESFVLNPAPVPLKQVICGRMRPVPTITELLASMKDQREELQALDEQDLEMRARLRNKKFFRYCREMQEESEKHRISPPQPVMSDLSKMAVKKAMSPKDRARAGTGRSISPGATARKSFGRTGGRFTK